jgi:STE24 endopeptidase
LKIYLFLILCIYILKEGFEYLLGYLNLRHLKRFGHSIPDEFAGIIDRELLKKTQDYEIEKTRLHFISSAAGTLVTIIFLFGGLLNIFNEWVFFLQLPFLLSGLLFFLSLSYAGTFLSIPFSVYSAFRIEKKYGFNTMTPKLWIADFLKSLLLSTIVTGIIVVIGLWLIQASPNYWWIWLWCFFLGFSLFLMYISPYVIEPLFNKFMPIDEPGLEERIRILMQKVNITVSRIFKMDASKRSRHTNAYFSGIGKVKRIILYDTLLEKMSHNEILAVLAHEAGHWKKKHILKMIVAVECVSLIGIYLSFRILRTGLLTDLFRIDQETLFAKLVILGFLGGIAAFPLTPLGNAISRRFEREADWFACELTGNKEDMISTLVKLSKDNLSNLHPHPLYASFYYSHPPVVQRIRDLKRTC